MAKRSCWLESFGLALVVVGCSSHLRPELVDFSQDCIADQDCVVVHVREACSCDHAAIRRDSLEEYEAQAEEQAESSRGSCTTCPSVTLEAVCLAQTCRARERPTGEEPPLVLASDEPTVEGAFVTEEAVDVARISSQHGLVTEAVLKRQLPALYRWTENTVWLDGALLPPGRDGCEPLRLQNGRGKWHSSVTKLADGHARTSWYDVAVSMTFTIRGPVYTTTAGKGGARSGVRQIGGMLSHADDTRVEFLAQPVRLEAACAQTQRWRPCESGGQRRCPVEELIYHRRSLTPEQSAYAETKPKISPEILGHTPCTDPCPTPSPCEGRAAAQNRTLSKIVLYDVSSPSGGLVLFPTPQACEAHRRAQP